MAGSFFSLLHQRLAARPEAVAIETDAGRTLRRGDLLALAAGYAAALAAAGARPGDRVAFQVAKSPEALALYLGCLRAGLVATPLNPAYTAAELAPMLALARPAVLVVDPERKPELAAAIPAGCPVLTLDADGRGTATDAAARAAPPPPPVERDPGQPAALLFTSGTTGRPKGVPLSHANLASNAAVLVEAWGIRERDVLLHALPIFHAHGLFVAAHTALLAGAAMLWLPRFETGPVLRLLPRASVMMGVPTFYARLLAEPGFARAVAGLRVMVSGSAPLPAETWRAIRRRTGHAVLERYGMSEILMHTSNPLRGLRRPGSVGPPLPGCEVRIVDGEDRDLPDGEVGHVLVRGPNVFAGYLGPPEAGAAAFTGDGWFRTGDLGMIEADGYLTLAGRARDLVISGGLNVYPGEVEAVIEALPGVVEAAVIGLPHADLGEAVTAVVAGDGLSEVAVIAGCRAALAGFKVPKRVLTAASLPRNAMGKVQKGVLRERHAGLYAGGG